MSTVANPDPTAFRTFLRLKQGSSSLEAPPARQDLMDNLWEGRPASVSPGTPGHRIYFAKPRWRKSRNPRRKKVPKLGEASRLRADWRQSFMVEVSL